MSINKITLMGNLGDNPSTKVFSNGDKVVKLSIATNSGWRCKRTGLNKEETEWFNVYFRGNMAEIAAKYLDKGNQVYIKGTMRTRKYVNEKQETHWITEIIGSELLMISGTLKGQDKIKGPIPNVRKPLQTVVVADAINKTNVESENETIENAGLDADTENVQDVQADEVVKDTDHLQNAEIIGEIVPVQDVVGTTDNDLDLVVDDTQVAADNIQVSAVESVVDNLVESAVEIKDTIIDSVSSAVGIKPDQEVEEEVQAEIVAIADEDTEVQTTAEVDIATDDALLESKALPHIEDNKDFDIRRIVEGDDVVEADDVISTDKTVDDVVGLPDSILEESVLEEVEPVTVEVKPIEEVKLVPELDSEAMGVVEDTPVMADTIDISPEHDLVELDSVPDSGDTPVVNLIDTNLVVDTDEDMGSDDVGTTAEITDTTEISDSSSENSDNSDVATVNGQYIDKAVDNDLNDITHSEPLEKEGFEEKDIGGFTGSDTLEYATADIWDDVWDDDDLNLGNSTDLMDEFNRKAQVASMQDEISGISNLPDWLLP